MAFKKAESNKSGSTPFFDEYKKEVSNEMTEFLQGTIMEPKVIKAVQSGKGFILNFDDTFSLFIWKSSTIGNALKKAIREEHSELLLLMFTKDKKGLSYELGFDDEIEVTLIEDKYEEGVYQIEYTAGTLIPIAPSENRNSLHDMPCPDPNNPWVLKPSIKASKKVKERSDG